MLITTPTEIGKHAKIIKAAQEDISNMDVLVCGRCLLVFHFIDDFEEHKQIQCQKENSTLRESCDTKPKIWAFSLWKATQINNNKDLNASSSWALYQTWVKLEESVRETWIVAGKTIQSFGKLGQGELQDMPVKITKTVVNNSGEQTAKKPLTQSKPQVTNLKSLGKAAAVSSPSQDSENEISPVKLPTRSNSPATKITRKAANQGTTTVQTAGTVAPVPVIKPQTSRRAQRTVPNSTECVEENVEKIVAKRFNPRRKMHEYLVKWEARAHDQNTWEPASHLENVPQFLETFEKQLARQKETRAAMQAKQAAAIANKNTEKVVKKAPALVEEQTKLGSPGNVESPSRPTRTSKTKAMDQVKQWVSGTASTTGSTSPSSNAGDANNDNERDWSMNSNNSSSTGGMKRKLEDSEQNDTNISDFQATATMEDLEDDLIPSHTVKRMKNGSSISVEVKTRNEKTTESKLIKVNGTSSARSTSTAGESLPVGPKSAEVIITRDSSQSGVVKRPGVNSSNTSTQKTEAQIRVLSKGESAVSSTGIVRIAAAEDATKTTTPARAQQIRAGVGGSTTPAGRPTPTAIAVTPRPQVIPTRTPGGTIIQRKTLPTAGNTPMSRTGATATGNMRSSTQSSPSSGRMIISRQGNAVTTTSRQTPAAKHVTPEQKILQLSKSGDLKVTKKVMTREDIIAQRAAQQQRQQQSQRQQHQSQVQIQKVQQITPPGQRASTGTTLTVRSKQQATAQQLLQQQQQQQQEEEEHQAVLCPITGKLIGQEDQQLQMEQEQQQEQQEQQELQQSIDANQLLLGTEQQVLTNEDGTPLLVTGEDGTVYQVAGKNAEGQTILVTQGPDGEQQFAYVATADGDDNQVLTLDNAVAEAVAHLPAEQQAEALAAAAAGEGQYLLTMSEAELAQHQASLAQQQQDQQEGNASGSGTTNQLTIQTGDGSDGQEANIPAEVVQAELPSPGGTRRVVLLLQDGTFMMTEMHDDEFKALNIAA